MKSFVRTVLFTSVLCATAGAQTPHPLVDFELMTWPEVKHALEQGMTTALIFNGGTEQRGPQGGKGWVRKELIATAVGAPVVERDTPRDSNAKRINNGITGDARQSTPEIGKVVSDLKVQYAVDQIRRLLNQNSAQSARK